MELVGTRSVSSGVQLASLLDGPVAVSRAVACLCPSLFKLDQSAPPSSLPPEIRRNFSAELDCKLENSLAVNPGAAGRFRMKREQLILLWGLLPESQGHNLALTVLHVPYSLDSGRGLVGTSTADAVELASAFGDRVELLLRETRARHDCPCFMLTGQDVQPRFDARQSQKSIPRIYRGVDAKS